MQISAALEGKDGILIHAEMAAKIGGAHCQPLAMAFGIGIAAFDNQAQRAQHGIRGLQLVGKLFQA